MFVKTTVDLRLEIQPALRLSSVTGTLGAIAKVIYLSFYHDEPVETVKRKKNVLMRTWTYLSEDEDKDEDIVVNRPRG